MNDEKSLIELESRLNMPSLRRLMSQDEIKEATIRLSSSSEDKLQEVYDMLTKQNVNWSPKGNNTILIWTEGDKKSKDCKLLESYLTYKGFKLIEQLFINGATKSTYKYK